MGLRERASDYSKAAREKRGVDLGLELRPEPDTKSALTEKTPPSSTFTPPSSPASPSTAAKTTPPVAPNTTAIPSLAEFPEHGTYKSKLDSVLNLLELYKEFGSVRSARDLWPIVAYSIMAQLGTKQIALFMEEDARMQLRHVTGFTLPTDYSFSATNRLCRELVQTRKVVFIDDILPTLPESEARFLQSAGVRYAAPVLRYEELRGVLLLNPPTGKAKFPEDDLFYLKVCGELLGAMEAQLILVAEAEKKAEAAKRAQAYRQYVRDFAADLGARDNNEPLKTVLENELAQHFPETGLLLLLREDFFLRAHLAVGFPRDSAESLEIQLVDAIVEKVKQGQRAFTAGDFDQSEALQFLGRYRQISAHPVFHRREFLAIAFIADTDSERVEVLSIFINQYVLQNHIAKFRDHATSTLAHADNPVMAIKNFIGGCEENLNRAQEPFAVIVTDIVNYNRLHNLHGDSHAMAVRDFTRRTLREIMETQDFSTEPFHGHFVSILRQKEAGDAWRLSRILQKQAAKEYPDEDLRPLYQHKIYARPHLQVIPFELLFKPV